MEEYLTREQAYDFLIKAQERRQKARDAGDEQALIEAAADCGLGHFHMGDTGLALRLFDEAGELIRKTGARRELLPTVIGMTGRALQRRKQWNDALDRYREAAASAEELKLQAQRLRWRGKKATTLIAMKQSEEGVAKLEQSIEYGRAVVAAGNPEAAEELASQLAFLAANIQQQDRPRAESLWREVFGYLRSLPPSRRHYLEASNYASALHRWGYDHQAQSYLDEALEIGRQIGADASELLKIVHHRAELLAILYGHEIAGDWLLAQRSIYPDHQWEIFQHAVAVYERGFFWHKMKDAASEWRKLPVPTPVDKPLFEMAIRYSFACRGTGEYDEALAALQQVSEHANRLGNPENAVGVRLQTVLVLADRGDFQEAISRADELWKQGVRDRLLARAFIEALVRSGSSKRAAEVLTDFEQHGGHDLDVAWMNGRLAETGVGDPSKAWYEYGQIAVRERNTEGELEALNRLIELYAPRSEEKFEASSARLRLLDKARSHVVDIFSDSAWFSVTPEARDFAKYLDDFVETAIAMERHQPAIYELERFRSQMLVDLLAERSARWQHDKSGRIQTRSYVFNEYDRARYRYQGLLARGESWQKRRVAAQELDRLKGMTAGAGGILHVAAGWQGSHFPQSYDEFFKDIRLYPGEALLFQHTLPEKTVFWLMEANGTIEQKIVSSFSSQALSKLYDEFRRFHRGAAGRGSRDLGVDLPPFDAAESFSKLVESLARSLVKWLKAKKLKRVFLIAGTSAAILPLYACDSWLRAGIELALLPTSRALSFTRNPRTLPVELFYPVNLAEHSNDFAAARDKLLLVIDPTRSLAWIFA